MSGINGYSLSSVQLPFTSSNILYVLFNFLFLFRLKKGIFHITGHDHYAALALPRNRTILTIHDLIFLQSYVGWKKVLLRWLLLELPVKRCLYITTVSEKTRVEILSLVKCDSSKIIVIHNPVRFTDSTPRINKLFKNPVILFIGTHPNKNLQKVIAALYGLKVHLRIIGRLKRTDKELLEKFAINFSVGQDLSDDEIQLEYASSDLLLFPSIYEGFGLPIIEAFQFGLPVITSNFPPMSEIAGDAAYLIDPYSIASIRQAVHYLIQKPLKCEGLRVKGYMRVRDFKIEKISCLYQDLYNRVEMESKLN